MYTRDTFILPADLDAQFGLSISSLIKIRPHDGNVGQGARDLVAAKSQLDQLTKRKAGAAVVRQVLGSHYCYDTIGPFCYAHAILPFFRSMREPNDVTPYYKALVSHEITIGESWKWTPDCKTEEQQDAVVWASFNALGEKNSSHLASYCYIPKLSLVLASEGKNRVALFRKLNLPIPAMVHDQDYPDAQRIRLFYIRKGSFAILDNRYVQQLISPELTRVILELYGVKIETDWPESYPSLDNVIGAFDHKNYSTDSKFNDVDMQPILYRQFAEEFIVPASLMDFKKGLKPSMITIGYGFLACTMLALSGLMSLSLPILATVLFTLAVASFVLLMLAYAPLFRCEVRQLADSTAQRHRRDLIEKFRQNDQENSGRR